MEPRRGAVPGPSHTKQAAGRSLQATAFYLRKGNFMQTSLSFRGEKNQSNYRLLPKKGKLFMQTSLSFRGEKNQSNYQTRAGREARGPRRKQMRWAGSCFLLVASE